ncbi:uncharacterized protein FN964_006272 [Alca torda]
MQGGTQACACCPPTLNAGDKWVSTLQCLADCRYNNHFTHHREGTTLGKAMAAVKQHIRHRCPNSKDHESIFEAGKNQPALTYAATADGFNISWIHTVKTWSGDAFPGLHY